MLNDPKTFILALIGGIIPSLLWLWFWLREKKEPKGLLALCFMLGMAAIIIVIPIQKFIQVIISSNQWQIIGWAAVEELVKYLIVVVILYKTSYIHEPIDWPIFLITTALGFAAIENTMFIIKPLSLNQATVGILTGNLRYLGSTLLHAISSGIIGIALGLSFYFNKFFKKIYFFSGFIVAVGLHSTFNFFIMKDNGSGFLKVFAFLWVATIINLLLFEKLRRMSENISSNYKLKN